MKIIQRQLTVQLVLTFLVCLALLVFLPAQFEIVALLEKVSSQEIELSFIWWHIILTLPNLLEDFLLLSFALSCSLVLGRFWSSGEMLASFSLGISYVQILKVILLVASIVVAFQVFVIIYLVPVTETLYDRLIAQNQVRSILASLPKQNKLQGFNDGKLAMAFTHKLIHRIDDAITLELDDFITILEFEPSQTLDGNNSDYHILRVDNLQLDMCLTDCVSTSSLQLENVKLQHFDQDGNNNYLLAFENFNSPFTLQTLANILHGKSSEVYFEPGIATTFTDLKLSDKLKLVGYSSGLLLLALVVLSLSRVNLGASMYSSLTKITSFSIFLVLPQYLLAEMQWEHWYYAAGLTILCQCIITASLFYSRETFWQTYQ